jgi:hypothetical protein
MTDKPGYYQGRHFTTYVENVKVLKRTGADAALEQLLLVLVGATEAESRSDGLGVAPWYYEELAKLYHARKDYQSELGVLERFASQRHAPGVKPPELLERLDKVRAIVRGEQR